MNMDDFDNILDICQDKSKQRQQDEVRKIQQKENDTNKSEWKIIIYFFQSKFERRFYFSHIRTFNKFPVKTYEPNWQLHSIIG